MAARTPTRPLGPAPLVVMVAAVAAACASPAGPADPPAPVQSEAPAATAFAPPPEGVFVAQGCEPRALIPSGVDSGCGRRVVAALFTQLVEYAPGTWRPRWGPEADRAVARSITSFDAVHWTIRLKEGWTFHDGEPLTAQSFVDAWNHAAYGPNAQPAAPLFQPIEGFADLRCPEADCDPPARSLAGVQALDEHTLRVTLTEPRRTFPWLLGHVAFSPLPSAAFEDLAAYGEAPVGNGPLAMDGTWEHDRVIRLQRFEDYAGARAASDGVQIRLVATPEDAWQGFVAGELDVMDELPLARADEARRRFALRFVEQPGSHYTFLVAPSHVPALTDGRLVEALSMAIDRDRIIRQQLAGTATPARSLLPPVLAPTAAPDLCGDACRHRPEAARRRFEQAGGLPEGGLTLWYPRSSDYEQRMQAIAGDWIRTFGLPPDAIRLQPLPFSQFLAHAEDRRVTGPYRMGWVMDVPSPRNFLEPLHGADGLLNLDGYRNEAAGRLLERADAAPGIVSSLELYDRAADLVLRDWHHIPLWYELHQAVHAERLGDVSFTPFGDVRLADVTVADA